MDLHQVHLGFSAITTLFGSNKDFFVFRSGDLNIIMLCKKTSNVPVFKPLILKSIFLNEVLVKIHCGTSILAGRDMNVPSLLEMIKSRSCLESFRID